MLVPGKYSRSWDTLQVPSGCRVHMGARALATGKPPAGQCLGVWALAGRHWGLATVIFAREITVLGASAFFAAACLMTQCTSVPETT